MLNLEKEYRPHEQVPIDLFLPYTTAWGVTSEDEQMVELLCRGISRRTLKRAFWFVEVEWPRVKVNDKEISALVLLYQNGMIPVSELYRHFGLVSEGNYVTTLSKGKLRTYRDVK